MPRILLINPPSPEQLGAPLLGVQYVAAALLARGCEVRVLDAAARYFDHDFEWLVAQAEAFAPDLIGFSLFTRWVWHAYRLVDRFRARFVADLDALPLPQTAQDLFDRAWYDPGGREVIPGGILTSRGCPARCTFCANYVTGRGFRYRSAEHVVAELNAYHERCGATFF